MESKIKTIKYKDKILAILVKTKEIKEPLEFFYPDEFTLQAGIHNGVKGGKALPHEHKPFKKRSVEHPQEIFYIQSGQMKVDLYVNDKIVKKVIMNPNDLLIVNTGHGVTFLKKTKLLEIKQGPYRGKDQEKRMIK